jgi:hypothetical protein
MALVFQYGSNTLITRINSTKRLNGSARIVSVVRTLNRFDFCFSVWSATNDCAAADIIEGGERQIYGVLYDIPDSRVFRDQSKPGLKCLDQIEGTNYERIRIDVEDLNGTRINGEVLTYVVRSDRRDFTGSTSLAYVTHIISGLESAKIPDDYIEYVKSKALQNNPALEL